MLGADWTQGHTTLGMVLTHSKGEGSYRLQAQTTDEAERNLSTTLRHRRLRFTEQSLLLWIWQVG